LRDSKNSPKNKPRSQVAGAVHTDLTLNSSLLGKTDAVGKGAKSHDIRKKRSKGELYIKISTTTLEKRGRK